MMASPDSVMIFAAGLGTRMKHLTVDRPKPLIAVAGRPLIDWALDIVAQAGIGRTVINLHYKGAQIETYLHGKNYIFSHEQPDLLETGGGLKQALPLLASDPVFTFNPDVVWSGPNPLIALKQVWEPDRMDALLLLVPQSSALSYTGSGDFLMAADGTLSRGPGMVYSGAQIIKTSRLKDIQDDTFSLNKLWDLMLRDRRIFGLTYTGAWCDVGRPAGIAAAQTLLAGPENV